MNDSERSSAASNADAGATGLAHAEQTHGGSAGRMLKAAREHAGLHIEALAAALKVPVRKLEALEGDRWEELTDATFMRALASSVARHLKLDPVTVLAALPAGKSVPLVISAGLGRAAPAQGDAAWWSSGGLRWVVGLLLVAAIAMYVAPQLLPDVSDDSTAVLSPVASDAPTTPVDPTPANLSNSQEAPAPVDAAAGASPSSLPSASLAPDALTTGANGTPATTPATAATSSSPAVPATVLMAVNATGDTWLEVRDDMGRLRVQRLVKAGERLTFDEGSTYTVVVGNAASTQIDVRGKPLDLMAMTKNNVARFEAK